MPYLRAFPREPDDFIVDDPLVLELYAQHIGADPGESVWADDIPDDVWDEAEQRRASDEEEEHAEPVAS